MLSQIGKARAIEAVGFGADWCITNLDVNDDEWSKDLCEMYGKMPRTG